MSQTRRRVKQIAWFFGLWLFGVLSVGIVAGMIGIALQAMQ